MFVGIIALLVIGIAFLVYNSMTFKLIGTDPSMGNFPSSASFVKLNFNKEISKNIMVSGTEGLVSSFSVTKKSLTIILNSPLSTDLKYQIYVTKIASVSGKKMKDLTYGFNPKSLPDSVLSSEQKQAQLNAQQQYNVIKNDSLISLLPFTGGGGEFLVSYTLKYSGQTTLPIVIITAPDKNNQTDALSWIKLIGADTNKYEIQYVTSQP